MILDLRAAKRILKQGNTVKYNADTRRDTIINDRDRSQEWKNRELQKVSDEESRQYRELGRKIQPYLESLQYQLWQARDNYDFHDKGLQDALNLIRALGGKLPISMQNQIAEEFRGRPVMLDALKAVYTENKYDTNKIDDMRSLFDMVQDTNNINTINEFVGYATTDMATPTWKEAQLRGVLTQYERALGLDTSQNPYVTAIGEWLHTMPESSAEARAAKAFLRMYGEKLSQDDADACTLAEMKLEEGFKA